MEHPRRNSPQPLSLRTILAVPPLLHLTVEVLRRVLEGFFPVNLPNHPHRNTIGQTRLPRSRLAAEMQTIRVGVLLARRHRRRGVSGGQRAEKPPAVSVRGAVRAAEALDVCVGAPLAARPGRKRVSVTRRDGEDVVVVGLVLLVRRIWRRRATDLVAPRASPRTCTARRTAGPAKQALVEPCLGKVDK